MKYTQSQLFAGLLVVLTLVGCGKSGDAPAASVTAPTAGTATSPEAAPAVQHQGSAPDEILAKFLESLRTSDNATATTLLTQKARLEAQKAGVEVRPIGDPSMKYQIGQTEFVSEAQDGAHVGSICTFVVEGGQTENFEVIWVLRRESQGWRIAGMATPGEENQPPHFADFEDPEFLKTLKPEGPEMVENEGAAATEDPNGALVPANGFAPPTTLQPRGGNLQNAENGAGNNPLR